MVARRGPVAEWNLRTKAGEASGNPQTGRRGAKAWYPDGAGSFYPASGEAGSAAAVGSENAGVMENGLVRPSVEGTPQGGPLSPLLSNLVLDELEDTATCDMRMMVCTRVRKAERLSSAQLLN